MYAGAWECTVGEMMHGPAYQGKNYPHFDGFTPRLDLFLKNAIAEELGYRRAKADEFLLFGFVAEYFTLAPKLRGARNVFAAVDPERLQLFGVFGSIIARTGMRGEADYALSPPGAMPSQDAADECHELLQRVEVRHLP